MRLGWLRAQLRRDSDIFQRNGSAGGGRRYSGGSAAGGNRRPVPDSGSQPRQAERARSGRAHAARRRRAEAARRRRAVRDRDDHRRAGLRPVAELAQPALLGPTAVRELAGRLGLRPNRALGQNFVVDAGTVTKIVAMAGLRPDDVVLEVGPGFGSLTLPLLASAGRG